LTILAPEATLRLAQVVGIEDHQRPARIHQAALGEAASQPPIAELAEGGAVVRKVPAEGLSIELTRARDVANGELDIVDTAIVAWVAGGSRNVGLGPGADVALLYAIHSNSRGLGASIEELFTQGSHGISREDLGGGSIRCKSE
jgi:hypothetical protein